MDSTHCCCRGGAVGTPAVMFVSGHRPISHHPIALPFVCSGPLAVVNASLIVAVERCPLAICGNPLMRPAPLSHLACQTSLPDQLQTVICQEAGLLFLIQRHSASNLSRFQTAREVIVPLIASAGCPGDIEDLSKARSLVGLANARDTSARWHDAPADSLILLMITRRW